MKQALATVTLNSEVMPKVHLIQVEAPDITTEAKPGQFLMVRCGQGHELILRRPFSIHQADTGTGQLSFLFAIVGKGTAWLSQLEENEKVDLLGPLGKGFSLYPEARNLLLIAGGIGIAPLIFLTTQALIQGKSVTLLLGAPTANQLYPEHLLPEGIRCLVTTEDGSAGKKGLVTKLLPEFTDWCHQICACGPIAMYRKIKAQKELQKKSVQISLEVTMGCGIGACYGCSLKTKHGLKQVCRDGPIFKLSEILWDEVKL